jgi:tetratricopeptide (TPR) repeat protein
MFETKAFKKYVKQLETGCFTHFSEEEYEEIISGFLDEYQTPEAEEALRRGLEEYPNSRLIGKLRTMILIDRGQIEEAKLVLEDYLDLETMDIVEMCFLIAMKELRYEDAFQLYVQAVKQGKTSAQLACERLSEVCDAVPKKLYVQTIERLANSVPKHIETQRTAARCLALVDAAKSAIPLLNRVLDADAYDAESWEILARCYSLTEQHKLCLNACEYGLALQPNNLQMLYMRGCYAYEEQDLHKAIPDLRLLYDIRTGKAEGTCVADIPDEDKPGELRELREMLASAYEFTDQLDQSVRMSLELCEEDPTDARKWYDLACRLMQMGNGPKGLEAIERCLEIEPRNEKYLRTKVTLLIDCQHKPKEIAATLHELICINPDATDVWLTFANLCRALNLHDQAYLCFNELRKLHPTNPRERRLMLDYFESIGEPLDENEY